MLQIYPWVEPPPQADPLPGQTPHPADPPNRRLPWRTVRILLECILVIAIK